MARNLNALRSGSEVSEGPGAVSVFAFGECAELARLRGEMGDGGRVRVFAGDTVEAAVDELERRQLDAVLAYQGPTSSDGLQVLARAREIQPDVSRILLCEHLDLELLENAAGRARILGLLLCPVEDGELRNTLQKAADRTFLARYGGPEIVDSASVRSSAGSVRELARQVLPRLPRAELHLDSRGLVAEANASAELILGRTTDQLVGRAANDLGVPCRQPGIRAGEMRGSPALCGSRDVTPVRSWGETRQILWSCGAGQDGSGGHTSCAVTFMDITDRDELDINIFFAKHEIESIFDSITDPTFLVDQEKRIVRANRALSRFLDKPFPAILGHTCEQVLAEKGDHRLCRTLCRVFRDGRRGREELDFGDRRIYKVHYFPILRACTVRHVVVRYHEITAEKEMENRLLQAEKLASIGELSAGIAHEINNPVGFISWNINQLAGYLVEFRELYDKTQDLAQRSIREEVSALDAWRRCVEMWEVSDLPFALKDANDIVRECNQGVERVRKIVRELRSYSHPATTEWEETDVHDCLETALTIASSELKHRCDVVREYGELPTIRGIAQRVIQVFINLLVNAAQAMVEHGRVTVRTGTTNRGVRIEVEDTGSGISQEIVNKIFDPFFTTKEVGEGTGLGLYLTRSIIEEHRGRIEARSDPGRGTCFTVELPFDPDHSELQSVITVE